MLRDSQPLQLEPDSYGFINRDALSQRLKDSQLINCIEIAESVVGRKYLQQRIQMGLTSFDAKNQTQPFIDFSFGYRYTSLHSTFTKLRKETGLQVSPFRSLGFHTNGVKRERIISGVEKTMTDLFPKDTDLLRNLTKLRLDRYTRLAFFELGFFDEIKPLQLAVIQNSNQEYRCIFIEGSVQKRAIESLIKLGYTDVGIATQGRDRARGFYRKITSAKSINRQLGIPNFAMQLQDFEPFFPGVVRADEPNNRALFLSRWINNLNLDPKTKVDGQRIIIDRETQAFLVDTRQIKQMICEINAVAPIVLVIACGRTKVIAEINDTQAQVLKLWPQGHSVFDATKMSRDDRAAIKWHFFSLVNRIRKFGWMVQEDTGIALTKKGRRGGLKLVFPKPL